MPSLGDRLREETRELRGALGARPFCVAIHEETLPKRQYVGWLRAMGVVVGALEGALDACDHPQVTQVWQRARRLTPALRRDLAYFDAVTVPATPALGPTIALAETVRGWRVDAPARLLGALFAVPSSRPSGDGLRDAVARQYDLTDAGLAFVSVEQHALADALDAVTDEHETEVVAGARAFLESTLEILDALHPLKDRDYVAAQALNEEAGHHAVTADPREMLAGIDAGVRTWDDFPYYRARYGERGRRFTRSDSAWLVTLIDMTPETARKQVRWIGGLLATRGMPTLLLERHLFQLHEELVRAVPERADRYARIRDEAAALREARLAVFDEGTFAELAASFPHESPIANVGPLIVGAVADERLGYPAGIEALVTWMTNDDRFSEAWCASVRELLMRARQT